MDGFDSNAIREAGAEAREIIKDMVDNITEAAERDDRFFRNGIELIDFEIAFGTPERPVFTIKAKIAGPNDGEAGSKANLGRSDAERLRNYPGPTG